MYDDKFYYSLEDGKAISESSSATVSVKVNVNSIPNLSSAPTTGKVLTPYELNRTRELPFTLLHVEEAVKTEIKAVKVRIIQDSI